MELSKSILHTFRRFIRNKLTFIVGIFFTLFVNIKRCVKYNSISTENWKEKLRQLERARKWDDAIFLMEKVLEQHPDDMDAAIFMNYLLMNLIVEEMIEEYKHSCYDALTKKYFDLTYPRFCENSEYLYYTGRTAVMSEWYFDISREDYEFMLDKAQRLEPHNPVYKWNYYAYLHRMNFDNKEAIEYAKMVLSKDSPVKKILLTKGACGEYILDMMESWSERIVGLKSCGTHGKMHDRVI